ncbi:MAG TPA: DUF6029 family protein [Bacteroidia bacterium]
MKKNSACFFATLMIFTGAAFAQENQGGSSNNNLGEIHGNFQVDAQYYNPDSTIGAPPVPQKVLSNGFCNLNYTKGNFKAGLRYESYLDVMQGFDSRYKGTGIPYRYAMYTIDGLEVTVGSFYEQFGSGLVLRAYEERGLGFDNALDGIRVKFMPYKGIYLKGLIGQQRFFFQETGRVRGFDGEIQFNELTPNWEEKKTKLMVGGSFVSKYQADQNPSLILPLNVGCYGGRFNLAHGNLNVYGEYAYKINDPNYDNGYIYKPGEAALLQLSYSKKGTGASLSVKRIDNMVYKSDRDVAGNALFINYNPVLTKQHTYGLLAFYPYASQTNGEFCYQAEFLHKFKKHKEETGTFMEKVDALLGGKYGTDFAINYSGAFNLDTTRFNSVNDSSKIGYKNNNYFGIGNQILYQDFNIEITKKISPKFKMTVVYANQVYNIDVIRVDPGAPNVCSNIGVVDMTYKYKDEGSIRMELQHLYTRQDSGSWAEGLLEWTPSEHWFVAGMDQYNYGNTHPDKRFHYMNVQVGYIRNANRITLGYGKQRAGIFCAGGVCRYVPAANGFTLSITSSF